MNHLGNVPPSHIPPQMMGQGPRLLTTAPPVPVVNAIQPLQIEMTPNTQMQQVMAAMAQGRSVLPQEQRIRSFNAPAPDTESRFACRESHSSPELPIQSPDVKHVRRISESSLASSGFVSSSSPGVLTASPQKIQHRNIYPTMPQQVSTPPTFCHSALAPSSTPRSYSPASSSSVSDNDSEALWRPW